MLNYVDLFVRRCHELVAEKSVIGMGGMVTLLAMKLNVLLTEDDIHLQPSTSYDLDKLNVIEFVYTDRSLPPCTHLLVNKVQSAQLPPPHDTLFFIPPNADTFDYRIILLNVYPIYVSPAAEHENVENA